MRRGRAVELSFLLCSLVSLRHKICMNYNDGIWDGIGIHIQLKRIIKYYLLINTFYPCIPGPSRPGRNQIEILLHEDDEVAWRQSQAEAYL